MARRKARAQHRRYEHRLRARVRHQRGCLDALGSTTRRLLGLRAGLEGRPLSRGEAASRLGISSRRAARLERSGLRTLRVACGEGVATAPPRVARLTRSAPTLQPASFLVPASSAPELKPAVELTKPRGKHGVESASATSRPSGGGSGYGPVSAAATSAPLESGGSGPGLALILAICLATLALLALVALRRSVAGHQRPEPAAAAAPPPAREPAATYVPPPQPEEPPPAQPASRAARAATVAATTAVGVLVRELLRRRGRR